MEPRDRDRLNSDVKSDLKSEISTERRERLRFVFQGLPRRPPVSLVGALRVPERSKGMVIFASSGRRARLSSRSRLLARGLNRAGFATFIIDLLGAEEAQEPMGEGQQSRMTSRLKSVMESVSLRLGRGGTPMAIFAVGSAAGPSLAVAADQPSRIAAVICRSGDIALEARKLARVRAPTLLVAGGEDRAAVERNRRVVKRLGCEHAFVVIPRTGAAFEGAGALDEVSRIARLWLERFLATGSAKALRAGDGSAERPLPLA